MDYENILPKALAKLFPEQGVRAEVESILSAYGTEKFHREGARVKTAILKVAGNKLEEIKRCTEIACCDYRDILCMAEYPNQSGRWGLKAKNPETYKKLVQKGLNQHKKWLESIQAV
ncbi:MAG: hypothetical protein C0622_07000 [Desulfuromonas sp.]|nr:MAG: hypothetical protein C0622_07000 [Desulfuromonas sp.]